MKRLASTHIYLIWVAQSYSFYQRNRNIKHKGQRDTLFLGCSPIKSKAPSWAFRCHRHLSSRRTADLFTLMAELNLGLSMGMGI